MSIPSSYDHNDKPKFSFRVHPGEPMSLLGLLRDNWYKVTGGSVGDSGAVTLRSPYSVCMMILY